jgi:hypothetical protein
VELDAISQPELEQLERLGGADVVVGILGPQHGQDGVAAAAMVRETLAPLSKVARAVVVCNNGTQSQPSVTPEPAGENGTPAVFTCNLPAPGAADTPQQNISQAYRSVFAVAGKLGVRACGVVASQPQEVTRQWIYHLIQPVLELGFDLVAPRYSRQKMEGLLNRSILSPLHRALYGEQLQNPVGPDFGLSGRLLQQILGQNSEPRHGGESNLLASTASTAASGGFQVCESHLGLRTQPPTDWTNLSSLLAEVLGPVFLEMERQAALWQRIRGSKPLPRFGCIESLSEDSGSVDVHRMVESFQLGTQNLLEVWGLLLPPTTLLELRKLARLPPDQLRMPDDLWARIVYDFALGHHLRIISRDHLLRSITPLYLGWIASYAREMETAGPVEVESRIERLSRAYETNKPYLVSRWRWPDRFSP